ncbi:hypothetical protein D3C86_2057970 [compost metagenome]
MPDRILDVGLQQHGRQQGIEEYVIFFYFKSIGKLVIEPERLDLDIHPQCVDDLLERQILMV